MAKLIAKTIAPMQLGFMNYQTEMYKWPDYSVTMDAVLVQIIVFAQWEVFESCFFRPWPSRD